jgi:hypothetical protein
MALLFAQIRRSFSVIMKRGISARSSQQETTASGMLARYGIIAFIFPPFSGHNRRRPGFR